MGLLIRIPSYAFEESAYVISTLFEISGVKVYYDLIAHDRTYMELINEGSTVKLHQDFFQEGTQPSNWYAKDRIPAEVQYFHSTVFDIDLIGIYGSSEESILGRNYECSVDIIGSAFFMLTRWEEYVTLDRDAHGRFPGALALAVKHDFIQRPVVNEYALFLRKCVLWMGIESSPMPVGQVTMSFDIDYIYKWKLFRNLLGAWKRAWPNVQQSKKDFFSYMASLKNPLADPYNNFEYVFQELKKNQISATFYFKAENYATDFDKADYKLDDERLQHVLTAIRELGYQVGLHPSYASFEEQALLASEKSKLQAAMNNKVLRVRQHFLRIEFPHTFTRFQEAGFKTDCSSMYTQYPGFRNGICSEFNYFDFMGRKTLDLRLIPLIDMMYEDRSHELDKVVAEMKELSEISLLYGGKAKLLWHNSDLDNDDKKAAFEKVLLCLGNLRSTIQPVDA